MRRKKYTLEEVKIFAESKDGICLSTEYKNNKCPLDWYCNKCDYNWTTNFKSVMVNNQWCPSCAGRPARTIEDANTIAISNNGICLSDTYINNKTNLLWKCNKCSNEWYARFDRVSCGTWCPKCNMSKGERLISKYLERNNVVYEIEWFIPKGRKKRFDFYLLDLNTFIEFDGVQHFQIYKRYTKTIEDLHKHQEFDIEKTQWAIDNGYRIIRIAYDQINNISDILDNQLYNSDHLMLMSPLYEYITKRVSVNNDSLASLNLLKI